MNSFNFLNNHKAGGEGGGQLGARERGFFFSFRYKRG